MTLGLTTIGTANQILVSNGTNNVWTTPTGTSTPVFSASPTFSGTSTFSGSAAGGFITPVAILNTSTTASSQSLLQIGQATSSTGNALQIGFLYAGAGSPSNRFSLGFYGGGGGTLTVFNSTSTAATLNTPFTVSGLLTASGGVSTTTLASSGLLTASGGISTTTLGASGLITASGGVSTTTLGASGLVTASGGIAATDSITITGTSNPSLAITVGSDTFGFGVCTAAGQISTSAAVGDAVIRNYNPGTSKALHLQSGAGAAAITIATGNAVSVTGTLSVASNLFSQTIIGSNPIYNRSQLTTTQTIPVGSTAILNTITSFQGLSAAPGLTVSATGYTNSTGRTVVVFFTYAVYWDPALGGGVVEAGIRMNVNEIVGGSTTQVIPTTYNATNNGSAIVIMAPSDTAELWVKNNLGGNLNVLGVDFPRRKTTISYYILN